MAPEPSAALLRDVEARLAVGFSEAEAWDGLRDHPVWGPAGRDLARGARTGEALAETLDMHADLARRVRRNHLTERRAGGRSHDGLLPARVHPLGRRADHRRCAGERPLLRRVLRTGPPSGTPRCARRVVATDVQMSTVQCHRRVRGALRGLPISGWEANMSSPGARGAGKNRMYGDLSIRAVAGRPGRR